jgi:hypothetical protein
MDVAAGKSSPIPHKEVGRADQRSVICHLSTIVVKWRITLRLNPPYELGGEGRRMLFCLSAATSYGELRLGKSSACIDAVEVEVAGDGNP